MSVQQKIEYGFERPEDFLAKLEELVSGGVAPESLTTLTPFAVHGMDAVLKQKTSPLRLITLLGAILGFLGGIGFMIFTVYDWPLNTGGKPLVSIPAFIIVAFECTILIGGVVSFLGFLYLGRLPGVRRLLEPRECGNRFLIIQEVTK